MSRYLITIIAFALLPFDAEGASVSDLFGTGCPDGRPWMEEGNGYYLRGHCNNVEDLANNAWPEYFRPIWRNLYNAGIKSYYDYSTGCETEVDECFDLGSVGTSDCAVVFPNECQGGTWAYKEYNTLCGAGHRCFNCEEFKCTCYFGSNTYCNQWSEKSDESAVAGESNNSGNVEEQEGALRVLKQVAENSGNVEELNSQNKALKRANKALKSALAELSAN